MEIDVPSTLAALIDLRALKPQGEQNRLSSFRYREDSGGAVIGIASVDTFVEVLNPPDLARPILALSAQCGVPRVGRPGPLTSDGDPTFMAQERRSGKPISRSYSSSGMP